MKWNVIFLSFIQLYVYLSPCILNSKILAAGWILYSTLKILEICYLTTYFVCMAILWPPVTLWGILESFLTRMCPLVCMFITYVWLLSCICIVSQKWQGRPKKLSKTGIKTKIINCVITFNFHLTCEWKKKGFSVFSKNSELLPRKRWCFCTKLLYWFFFAQFSFRLHFLIKLRIVILYNDFWSSSKAMRLCQSQ